MTTQTKSSVLSGCRAFGSFSVDDLDRAKSFYGDALGLDVREEGDMGLELRLSGGMRVFLYAKKDHRPAAYTVLNFHVTDIDAAVSALRDRGVRFERYAGEIATDETGVCRGRAAGKGPDIAWFKDPAGNVLSVLQE